MGVVSDCVEFKARFGEAGCVASGVGERPGTDGGLMREVGDAVRT